MSFQRVGLVALTRSSLSLTDAAVVGALALGTDHAEDQDHPLGLQSGCLIAELDHGLVQFILMRTSSCMNRIAKCCLFVAIAWLALASASLGGCAEPQASPLAQHQAAANGKRLFYIGLALYAEPWSENDVVELADKLRTASRYHVVPMIASNVASARNRYPVANDANIAAIVNSAAAQAVPGDIAFVLSARTAGVSCWHVRWATTPRLRSLHTNSRASWHRSPAISR